MKVVLLNDTSDNRHFGCELVGSAYRTLLAERGIELVGSKYRKEPLDPALCDKADLVIVNGEGCIHHGGYKHLQEIGHQWPSVLLNCSIEEQPSFDAKDFLLATVRESMSGGYTGLEVVPDLVFSHTVERLSGTHTMISDGSARNYAGMGPRAPQFVRTLLSAKHAALGRFHAVCLAAMAGVPFSAWKANTWKMEGIMADMGASDHYYDEPLDAIENIPATMPDSVGEYAEQAKLKINDLFDRIAQL